MRRIIALSTLIALAVALGAPSSANAQTQSQSQSQTQTQAQAQAQAPTQAPTQAQAQAQAQAPAVPGPYQSAVQQIANPYGNSANGQPLPYWMRPQQGAAIPGTGTTPVARNFIPGWTWTRNAPGQGHGARNRPQIARPYGAGYWPGPAQTGYSIPLWTPPGYAPGRWPSPPYGAPQYYGAPPQPNQ